MPQTTIDPLRAADLRVRAPLFDSKKREVHLAPPWLALASIICLVTSVSASAQPAPQQKSKAGATPSQAIAPKAPRPPIVPAPPRRPQTTTPSEPSVAPPDTREANPPALPPPAALPPLDPSIPPPTLPRASRQAMRRCALEWEKMKRQGHVGAPMWREFATKCLTR